MLNRLKNANRRHCAHKGLWRCSTLPARGSSNTNANAQRSRLSVMGDTSGATQRPTTALPDHSRGGMMSSATAVGVNLWVILAL